MPPRSGDEATPLVTQPAEERTVSDRSAGTLVLIGGALSPRGRAMRAFLDRTRARETGRIVVLTTASADPGEAAKAYAADFRVAGAGTVHVPILERGIPGRDQEIADMIAGCDGVFLGGGDQVKLVTCLTGSCTGRAIRQHFHDGGVVGGTSAGAAALTELTMAGGEVDEEGNLVEQYIGPGLGLLGYNTIIDTHFSQRRRLQRLFMTVAQQPELMGLGIDEDTAMIIDGHMGEVVGAGGVTFVDGRDTVRYDNARDIEKGRQLTLSALRVGIVGSHYKLDLRERELEDVVRMRGTTP
jgi:cyanophycinase